jgi:hypothetical protein
MMPTRSLTSTSRPIRRLAALAAVSLATVACGSGATEARVAGQATVRTATTTKRFSADYHPLDEATVRKVAAVMRAWTPPEPPPPRSDDPANFTRNMKEAFESTFTVVVSKELIEKDSTATIDRTLPLKAAIVSQGLSSRTFAESLMAIQAASLAIDLGDFFKSMGNPAPEPSGIRKANMDLVRKVRAEGALPTGWW